MTDRFSPADIFNGHRKGLRNRRYTTARPSGRPDVIAIALLYGVPVLGVIASYWRHLTIAEPNAMLTAFGILVGALLMAFTQIAAWRDRFTQRLETHRVTEVHQRDSLDEAVAHVLMALYGSIGLFALTVIGMNFLDDKNRLHGGWAAFSIGLGAYVFLLMLLIAPKLYTAYAVVNQVDDEMSGLVR